MRKELSKGRSENRSFIQCTMYQVEARDEKREKAELYKSYFDSFLARSQVAGLEK
jgi:hypothetical protein